jgi:hypothetical protein
VGVLPLCGADVRCEEVPVRAERATGVRAVAVEDAARRRRVVADLLARKLVRPGDVELSSAIAAIGEVELFPDGRLFVGLQPSRVVLVRQRGVDATHEATTAIWEHADLPVQVPGRQELTKCTRRFGEEVGLFVLVPVDEIAGLTRDAARLGRRRSVRSSGSATCRVPGASRSDEHRRKQHRCQRSRGPPGPSHAATHLFPSRRDRAASLGPRRLPPELTRPS